MTVENDERCRMNVINNEKYCHKSTGIGIGNTFCQSNVISQLPKLCVKISILRHRRMWVRSFSMRLTSVTFAEDKVLIFLILHKKC